MQRCGICDAFASSRGQVKETKGASKKKLAMIVTIYLVILRVDASSFLTMYLHFSKVNNFFFYRGYQIWAITPYMEII